MKWALVCGVLLAGIWLVTSALPVMADGDSVGITATMPLSVYSVSSSAIGATSATITWTTNGNASSQVFYDTVSHTNLTDYAFQTAIDNTLVLTHSQSLGSLNASTTYYFRVVSTATVSGSAVQSVSNEGTFTTLAALNISAVTAGSITSSTATITWTTNNPADSQVFYDTASHGSSNDYADSTPVNNSTVLNHNQNLSTLTVNTTYYYRVRSTATISGNNFVTVSAEYTFK
ncbi:MAG: fibronectin type III domain-containing protein, partial [Dehalococcoidales bacterium]